MDPSAQTLMEARVTVQVAKKNGHHPRSWLANETAWKLLELSPGLREQKKRTKGPLAIDGIPVLRTYVKDKMFFEGHPRELVLLTEVVR